MFSSPGNLTLEEGMFIMQFLRTLDDDVWKQHKQEFYKKLTQFYHDPGAYEEHFPSVDELPF